MSDKDIELGCWGHENCNTHKIPICQCTCWEFVSQCDEIYTIYKDGRPRTPDIHIADIQMDTSNKHTREMGNNNQQTRNKNSDTTETICTGTSNNKRRHDNTKPNTSDERDGNNSSLVFVRPGTPPKTTKHVTTDRPKKKWKTSHTVPHKHQQPNDKERNFPRNIENIKPIHTRDSVDSNRNIHRSDKSIHNSINGRNNTMPTTTSRNNSTPEMAIPGTSTMGQTTKTCDIGTPHNKSTTNSNSSEQNQNQTQKQLDKHTLPSSSTSPTKTQTGNKLQEQNQVQHSSPSTTTTTTTSSTHQTTREEMEVDSEDELLTTWVQQLQEIQKSIPRTLRFSFSGGSFYIASATASKAGVSMVLELEQ